MTTLEAAAKPDNLSPDELQDRINNLQNADLIRLEEIARKYVGGHELAADDLVQEAICRVLNGERKTCPSKLSIISFLSGVMKSITYDERQEAKQLVHYAKDSSWDKFQDSGASQEALLLKAEDDRQYYKSLEVFFEGDEESLLTILYLQDGYSPGEIREAENWTKTQYDTIRKRIKRRIDENSKGAKI